MQFPHRLSGPTTEFWNGKPQQEQWGGTILKAITLFQQLLQTPHSRRRDIEAEQRRQVSG
jgi:hypothetical protein